MGAFDGGEICEVVGSFLLYKLPKSCEEKDIGFIQGQWISKILKSEWL